MSKKTIINNNQSDKNKELFGGIMGLWLLLVTISIAYSSFVIWTGLEGIIPKIMIAPMALYGATIMVKRFIK